MKLLGKAALWVIGIVLLMLLTSVVAWKSGMDPQAPLSSVAALAESTASWRTPMQVVRCALWGLVWWQWAWIGRRWFGTQGNEEAAVAWFRSRPMVIALLALVEGLILLRQVW